MSNGSYDHKAARLHLHRRVSDSQMGWGGRSPRCTTARLAIGQQQLAVTRTAGATPRRLTHHLLHPGVPPHTSLYDWPRHTSLYDFLAPQLPPAPPRRSATSYFVKRLFSASTATCPTQEGDTSHFVKRLFSALPATCPPRRASSHFVIRLFGASSATSLTQQCHDILCYTTGHQ